MFFAKEGIATTKPNIIDIIIDTTEIKIVVVNPLNKNFRFVNPSTFLESLNELKNTKFDMVFIDADKMNYKEYYERSLKLVDKGGLIIIDNVLWHGEVADEDNLDKYTVNIREFNSYVSNDKRVEQIIVPLGDGMTVCRVL